MNLPSISKSLSIFPARINSSSKPESKIENLGMVPINIELASAVSEIIKTQDAENKIYLLAVKLLGQHIDAINGFTNPKDNEKIMEIQNQEKMESDGKIYRLYGDIAISLGIWKQEIIDFSLKAQAVARIFQNVAKNKIALTPPGLTPSDFYTNIISSLNEHIYLTAIQNINYLLSSANSMKKENFIKLLLCILKEDKRFKEQYESIPKPQNEDYNIFDILNVLEKEFISSKENLEIIKSNCKNDLNTYIIDKARLDRTKTFP